MNSKAFQLATDLTLAFVSTFVIIMAAWPASVSVQEVQCRTGDEAWTTYRLAIDDPDLDRLRAASRQPGVDQPTDPDTTVLASWRKQLADHYASLDQTRLDLQQQLTENKVAMLRPEPSEYLFSLSDNGTGYGGVTSKTVAANREAAFSKAAFRLPTADQLSAGNNTMLKQEANIAPADTTESFNVPSVGLPSRTSQGTAMPPNDPFVQLPPAPAPAPIVEPKSPSLKQSEGAAYWQSVAQSASNPLASGDSAPRLDIRFLKQRKQSWSPLAFQVAFLLALLVAVGFKAWSIKSPRIAGQPFFAQPQQVIGRWATLTVLVAIGFVVSTTLLG